MNISKTEIIRIKTIDDIIETEEGLLLKNALMMMRNYRRSLFDDIVLDRDSDEEYSIILQQLIKKNNSYAKDK